MGDYDAVDITGLPNNQHCILNEKSKLPNIEKETNEDVSDIQEMCRKNDEEISELKNELTKFYDVEYELNRLKID